MFNIKYIKNNNRIIIAEMITSYQINNYSHGGCALFLSETISSLLSYNNINTDKFISLCIEISGTHIKYTKKNKIIGVANFTHKGNKLHFIEILIYNISRELISKCKTTHIILKHLKNIKKK
jgi:uncharacterized protein (TIGR00369 family)